MVKQKCTSKSKSKHLFQVGQSQALLNCQKNKTNLNFNNLAIVPFKRHNNCESTVVAHSKA